MNWFSHIRRLSLCVTLISLTTLTSCAKEPYALGISSYNYSTRYIGGFSVNGQGGGNIGRANDQGWGVGGVVCCVTVRPDQKFPFQVTVKWFYGREEDDKGNVTMPDEPHEATVSVNGPLPADPDALIVHFLPGNKVEAEIIKLSSMEPMIPFKFSPADQR